MLVSYRVSPILLSFFPHIAHLNLGWVGFDISNSISPDDKYVKLAIGFDYIDVIPISGIRVGESDEEIKTNILIESKQ